MQTFTAPTGITIHSLPVTLPFERIVVGLNALQPTVVCGYPTAVHHLAAAAEAGSLTIAPRAVATGGEPLLPEIRAAAEAAWGVPVHNWWLTSEGGPMGISCGWGSGMHLSEDLLIIEPVDLQGERVPPGVRSAKLPDESVQCCPAVDPVRADRRGDAPRGGVPMWLRASPDRRCRRPPGRELHLSCRSRRASPRLSIRPRSRAGIVEYQVCQTPLGAAVQLRLGAEVDLGQVRLSLVGELASLGLRDPVVTLTQVQCLERQATGKLKRFRARSDRPPELTGEPQRGLSW
jgi:hypothetical protein